LRSKDVLRCRSAVDIRKDTPSTSRQGGETASELGDGTDDVPCSAGEGHATPDGFAETNQARITDMLQSVSEQHCHVC
jgi:hypothetical protein